MILDIDQGVHSVDLSHLTQYLAWHYLNAYFPMTAGENHHLLLAYLSNQLNPGALVCDLGTQYGASALALSYNKLVKVRTYDLLDYVPAGAVSFRNVSNITGVIGDCFTKIDEMIDSDIILLDISPHNGQDESRILSLLLNHDYRGLLICDDINWNDPMKQFFKDVNLKKYDVTRYGHWSGTGIIVFDPDTLDVRVA